MSKKSKTPKKPLYMPERIEDELPICPWCGNVYSETEMTFEKIDCRCGMRFETERKIVYISRPMEYRE